MSSIQLLDPVRRSAWSLPRLVGALSLLALLTGAGCKGDVTVDMATEEPANPNITAVMAKIRGLEFTGSSGTKKLEFRDPQSLNFMDYSNNNLFRLFTDEDLPEGSYTGVRLLIDTDQDDDEAFVTVTGTGGGTFPMNITQGNVASISFKFEKNKSDSESFTLMLDLRQSLTFNDSNDEFTFKPVLRAVRNKDISSIGGDVTVTCPAGGSLSEGAVYLFQGKNITPDDLDGAGVEPFATTPVFRSTNNNNSFFYSLRVLPAGDYTLALTCLGNDEDTATSQDLEFRNIVNVELDKKEVLDRDLP